MSDKEKLTLSINEDIKMQAKILSAKTGVTVSEIFELLIQGTSESEIIKMYNKSVKGK